jgi:hypothetical protein
VVTRTLVAALVLGSAIAGFFETGAALAGSPAAVLRPTLVLGTAEPIQNGVKVGPAGAEWALPGGAQLTAEHGAELRVIAVPQQLALAGRRRVASYTVMLKSGIVRARVPASGSTAVIVSAPRKTSVLVAGGEARIAAGQQIAVANAEGATSVSVNGSAFHAVAPGFVEVPGGPKHPLLQAPSLAGAPSVLLSYGKPAELDDLRWDAVPGARAYRLEIRDAATQRIVARGETPTPAAPTGFAALDPGNYSVRIAAVDAMGIESAHPLERPLCVVGVHLPLGAFVDAAGVVRFPPGGSIGFGHPEGVEMSFGQTGAFTPAPPSLGLFRSQPFLVRLRAAGTDAARDLWLTPRVASAKVQFGSRAPRWPGKPLAIDVQVDEEGGDAAAVRLAVSVGVEPVAVEFTRQGSHWHGVLAPRPGNGPWVVRVEVKDGSGLMLGRDFVEVAGAPADTSSGGT